MIEPGDGSMTSDDVIDTTEFEDLVNPLLLLEVMCIRNPLLHTCQPEFKISQTHKIIVEKIENEGILVASESRIVAGFIDIGIIARCLSANVCTKQMEDIIKGCKGLRSEKSQRELTTAINGISIDKHDSQHLKKYACKCSDDIRKYMEMKLGETIIQDKNVSVPISRNLRQAFERITSKDLNSMMYKVGKGGGRVTPTIPRILYNANKRYRKALVNDKTATECLRAAFVIGLRIFGKWMLKGLFPSQEFNYSKLLYAIEMHKNDQDAAKFAKRKEQWWQKGKG